MKTKPRTWGRERHGDQGVESAPPSLPPFLCVLHTVCASRVPLPAWWTSTLLSRLGSDFTFFWKPLLTPLWQVAPSSHPQLHTKARTTPRCIYSVFLGGLCASSGQGLQPNHSRMPRARIPLRGSKTAPEQIHFPQAGTVTPVSALGRRHLPEKQRMPSTAEYHGESPELSG